VVIRGDLLSSFVQVRLAQKDDFLKIRETLSRIGIANKERKHLTQTCHILHKRGFYYITHFKEMFLLDGKEALLTEEDFTRRNQIAMSLEKWGLLSIVNKLVLSETPIDESLFTIVAFKDKPLWMFTTKYSIGKKSHV